jgi:hypothetical protein
VHNNRINSDTKSLRFLFRLFKALPVIKKFGFDIMSHWNHRVIRRHDKKADITTFQIHEIYYNDNNATEGWTESPVEPMGESTAELREGPTFFLKLSKSPY